MKLDINCVRDVLLAVEDNDYNNSLSLSSLHDKLPNYSLDELEYTCLKLSEGGFLHVLTAGALGKNYAVVSRINDLTFQGHEFLDNIRNEDNWNKLSTAIKQGGAASLRAIASVALDLGTSALKSKLGLQ
ncbi:MAG: DUF2513 domain-containing protein [Blautia sp.]|nr:DUF2513 domain-containing protein [Blautia sp.]